MATIRDVARLAGVSVATVSRVINKMESVNPETAGQVLKAIEQLQYEPNAVARGLAGKRMGIIALILPDILNPFFPALARGVEDVAHKKGLTVILGNSDDVGLKESSYIKALKKKYVDGFIFASNTIREEDVEGLRKERIPIVLLDRGLDTASCAVIRSNNRQGAKLAVRHLIEQGCRSIAHIYGPQDFITARERLLGYEEAAGGLKGYSPSLMIPGNFDIESGRKAVEQLLARHSNLDGIFAGNDLMAVGALKALHERGIRVPEQVKVCGFDGIGLAEITEPELTTIAQPVYEMGGLAARILIEEIESGIRDNHLIELDVTLVPRKSTVKGGS
ncbi:transcriptional regulator [Desulfosporosinus orientis DSM 765]|uniref:Transcriptional regulator n=1 Tax=Desulfosporosinus orientis (strain ATCC 19365 / DSM 765 / NCIMB 8382 / VKM B-1628 / Singapore I) TaxID=768706 RepID=G7WCG3_DESOD|nr:LacI family DNA-binding transcriptional regulator [Desulfosporosinus orientis]AET66285.1 transcriptional regulator [Desulfosporosinus orientis DSM 765]